MSLITVRELATMLRVNKQTIYQKVRRKEIPCVRMGEGKWSGIRFDTEVIHRWLKANGVEEQESVLT